MKTAKILILGALIAASVGCSYGGVARVGKGKAIVLRNDGFLFGLLRKAMVCDVDSSGLSNCQENEQP
ncbi:MAG: hypothetical protein H6626_07425 [Pseudobdellovibrionaceae bacterium]|nr:hypothetical protein [Bdellovibrionales bacterium]USN46060.1 MAG: hypothetical protein H6626_07425 [Pseudobdellovibrionaceae bacterium]